MGTPVIPQGTEMSVAIQVSGPVGLSSGSNTPVGELLLFLGQDEHERRKGNSLWVVFARVIIHNNDSSAQFAGAKLMVGNVPVDEVDVRLPAVQDDPLALCLSLQAVVNLRDDLRVELTCSGYNCNASQISMIALHVTTAVTEELTPRGGGGFEAVVQRQFSEDPA